MIEHSGKRLEVRPREISHELLYVHLLIKYHEHWFLIRWLSMWAAVYAFCSPMYMLVPTWRTMGLAGKKKARRIHSWGWLGATLPVNAVVFATVSLQFEVFFSMFNSKVSARVQGRIMSYLAPIWSFFFNVQLEGKCTSTRADLGKEVIRVSIGILGLLWTWITNDTL